MANQTIQQKRAAFALDEVAQYCKENGGKVKKELSQLIVGLPTMILTNGIGQTFAFLLSKSKDKSEHDAASSKDESEHGIAFKTMKTWILNADSGVSGNFKNCNGADNIAFLRQFTQIDQKEYIAIQHECLRLVEWLKRYARAFEEDKDKARTDQ